MKLFEGIEFGSRIDAGNWQDYELLDAGGFEKLERFGKWVLRRPEPQAIWDKSLSDKDWQKLANASFLRGGAAGNGGAAASGDSEKGSWHLRPEMQDRWWISYPLAKGTVLKFRLGLTSFKHVGLFPEQAANWDWIYQQTQQRLHLRGLATGADAWKKNPVDAKPKVLNLFAYTGGASLAAFAAGADVTHVDSVKQVVTWGKENMEQSGLDGIRWLVEDAFKFVQREVRRGKKYDGILLDPPAYGRGPEGEKWLLEKQLNELMGMCGALLQPDGFFLLNLYSMGFSAMVAENLMRKQIPASAGKPIESGELFVRDKHAMALPLGTYLRF